MTSLFHPIILSNPRYEGIRSGVRGYQIRGTRGTRVSDPGYEVSNPGTRVSDPGYEGIRSGVRGYQIRGTRVSNPGYEGMRPGVNSPITPDSFLLEYGSVRSGVSGYWIRGMWVI